MVATLDFEPSWHTSQFFFSRHSFFESPHEKVAKQVVLLKSLVGGFQFVAKRIKGFKFYDRTGIHFIMPYHWLSLFLKIMKGSNYCLKLQQMKNYNSFSCGFEFKQNLNVRQKKAPIKLQVLRQITPVFTSIMWL